MTASPRLPLICALICALAMAPAIADAAETVRWPIAWKAGEVASFDTESLVREIEAGAAQTRRITDRTDIRTVEVDDNGYALAWITRDSRVEAVEGDRGTTDMLAPMLDELDGFEVVIELDRSGHYRRVRNLDAVAVKLRTTMKPIFAANLLRMFNDADPKVSKYDRDAMLTLAQNNLEASLDTIITTRSVEAMSSAQAKALSTFVGKPLVVGKRYRDAEPMDSPMEAVPLPASREYVLSLVDDDPALARIRWTHTLDPGGDAEALWTLAGELTGKAEPGARVEDRPADLVLQEEGVVLFRRDTGAIEMMETVEISRYGKTHDEHERYRMRRSDSARTWAQEEAAAKR